MARKKKPIGETTEQADERRELELVANTSNRSEKTSWNRKMNNMVSLLAELRPLEDQIMELALAKQEIFDRIQVLRNVMVRECVHPFEQLVHKNNHAECKFCLKKVSIPRGSKKETK
jgi:hypothetical protein